MNASSKPSLTYQAQQYRVRVEISRFHVLASSRPPEDLVKRAKAKLESVKQEGKIAFFDVYEDKLTKTWEALRNATQEDQSLVISLTLAVGAPLLEGLKVEKGPSEKAALVISAPAGVPYKTWQKEWVRATILRRAVELGVVGQLLMSQVQAVIMKIFNGEPIHAYPIPLLKSFPLQDMNGKGYAILANRARGEVALVIADLRALVDQTAFDGMAGIIAQTAEKLKATTGGVYRFHKVDLHGCIQGSWKGPERVGVGMPMIVLAVTSTGVGGTQTQPASGEKTKPKLFQFRIAPDLMSAAIHGFTPKWYSDPNFKMSKEAFTAELQAGGILYGMTDDMYKTLEEAWSKRENLEGKVVAAGHIAEAGQESYVHLSYKDAPKNQSPDGIIDIREAQQRTIVNAGQLVAELRFKVPPVVGKTVTGQSMQPPPGDALILKVGEGIAQREPGKFYAIFDGVPEYENDTLTVSKVFVHNGDVNLKSGNVRFDGPVEIKGSIEDGATVDVKGPLIVHGMIRAAFVRSEENIEVKEGIVTTERGRVICDNDVKADFTENSHIECSGSLLVNKAVLNSRVIAGKNIVVSANDGTLGGGNISCWSLLLAANIGFKNGAKTNLLLGVDAKALRKISIREKRLTKLREAGERYKNEFRELAQKKEAQMTAKHKQIKEKTKENLMRIKAVVEKAEMLLTNAKGSVKYNPDAIMGAQMTLSANCNIEIGGNPVQLETDFLATAVTAKRRRDGHACPIDDVKSEIERRVGSTTGETKKAG